MGATKGVKKKLLGRPRRKLRRGLQVRKAKVTWYLRREVRTKNVRTQRIETEARGDEPSEGEQRQDRKRI